MIVNLKQFDINKAFEKLMLHINTQRGYVQFYLCVNRYYV